MLISLVFMLAIDVLIKINLIGFIPEQARTYLGLDTVGVAEFFALLYIAYEVVSIFKNMQRREKPQEREYLPLWK